MVPRALGGREDGEREARRDADRRGHRLPVQRLLSLAVARGRGGGVERRGRVGGPSPQGPVPLLAGLMDGNGCSIGTHILSYKPQSVSMLGVSAQVVSLFPLLKSSPHFLPLGQISCSCVYRFRW